MFISAKVELFTVCKKINFRLLLKRYEISQLLLNSSYCENSSSGKLINRNRLNIQQNFQNGNCIGKEEELPSVCAKDNKAFLEPIKLIPPEIRHLQDARILYSSLFPKTYNKPNYIKVDLRDVHVNIVKEKWKENAVEEVIAIEYKDMSASKVPLPSSEPFKELFPYFKYDALLASTKRSSLTLVQKHKVNYEALPEVDRKKELSALLRAYDANEIKPVVELTPSAQEKMSMQSPTFLDEASKVQKSMHEKILSNEEEQSCSRLVKTNTKILHKPVEANSACNTHVLSTNVQLEESKVCTKCKVLLDPPLTSEGSTTAYIERQDLPTSTESQNQLCQRCNFDVTHSSAAHVLVPPDHYLDVLQPMSTRYSLVLVVLDVMDAPCSIHPDIMHVIGRGQPVIVVANKVDLLPLDAMQSLRTMWYTLTEMVKNSRLSSANIIDTVLVSAKTGFGITELRTLLQGQWRDNGDVFLVGGAGCGKTSLFKALAESIAADQHLELAHRVQPYNWPLTRLGLLKFEMKRVHGELRSLERGDLVERTVRPFKHLPRPVAARPSIPARPEGESPYFPPHKAPLMIQDNGAGEVTTLEGSPSNAGIVGADRTSGTPELQQQNGGRAWLYDTPSAVMPMQVLDLLTEEEIRLLTPRTKIKPQTFRLAKGRSLFLAGLARIDILYLHHPEPLSIGWHPHDNAKLTVYAAKSVPRTLVKTVEASSVYRDHLGDEVLMVPCGSSERLQQWPVLAPQNFTATGPNDGVAAADIVLPSVGFVSVWLHPLTVCSLRVWTPGGRGAFLRSQSLLPYAIHLKGVRQRGGLVYDDHEPFVEKKSVMDPSSPPSPDRRPDDDPRSVHVQMRHKLGYQRMEGRY